jgi:hypothetical protein
MHQQPIANERIMLYLVNLNFVLAYPLQFTGYFVIILLLDNRLSRLWKRTAFFRQANIVKKQKPHAPKILLWNASHRAAHKNAVSPGSNAGGDHYLPFN